MRGSLAGLERRLSSGAVSVIWRFRYQQSPALPPLAWLAWIADGEVVVRCGTSVRTEERGFVEGTWVGESAISALPSSTTVFGSGIIAEGDAVVIVPPSHPLERLYLFRAERSWLASNSFVWLLDAAGVELDPDVLYPPLFLAASLTVRPPLAEIPMTGDPITAAVYDNFRITATGELVVVGRPLERPFESYEDFHGRLTAGLRSAVANAPGYEMAVSVSSGYDSTAVAALAAPLGCRRALTFTEGKPVKGNSSLIDSGAASAAALGMNVESFDRLAYLGRTDVPEAEFLASGMSGEDVVMAAMDQSLKRTMLLTGSESFRLKGNPFRPGLHRGDLSAASLTEFRLRLDFVHVPILVHGRQRAAEPDTHHRICRDAAVRGPRPLRQANPAAARRRRGHPAWNVCHHQASGQREDPLRRIGRDVALLCCLFQGVCHR